MFTLRLRYENGHFLPLDPVEGFEEGQEIVVQWEATPPHDPAAYQEMLDQTAGLWAGELGEQIEDFINDARQKWDAEWQERLKKWDET